MPFPYESSAQNPEGPVGAGIDSILMQDGRPVTFASDVSVSEDFEVEGVRVLGFHGDLFHKSMGYTANITVGTFLIRQQDHPGALYTPGYQPDGRFNLNKAGSFDFTLIDVDTLTVLQTALRCKLATQDTQYPTRGMNIRNTTWRASVVLPGLETS